ncbi:MAG: PIN domain-containing protein [Solirubrobacterales bacterium]|nr:PIN domain-containing protein [Solirubrobacterales bacterium]
MILIDTSGLLSALDSNQSYHQEAAASLSSARPPLLLSPFVLAELDYLIASRVGHTARTRLLEEVERAAYALEPMSARDITSAREIIDRYADLGISLADASIVVLSQRHRIRDILTLDERHFRTLRSDGEHFRVLPADAR